jgi:hypothetical protein
VSRVLLKAFSNQHSAKQPGAKTMADKNLMSAIAGLSDAKPDPDAKPAAKKKSPKVVNIGKGGSYQVKDSKPAGAHPHRNLGTCLHPAKGK